MKCSGSPTICTAVDPTPIRSLAAQFEGLIFAEALRPLTKALGPMGDIATERIAGTIAESERGGFADELSALLHSPSGGL